MAIFSYFCYFILCHWLLLSLLCWFLFSAHTSYIRKPRAPSLGPLFSVCTPSLGDLIQSFGFNYSLYPMTLKFVFLVQTSLLNSHIQLPTGHAHLYF